ncbi:helix-turn-helix transcriptional regulator [Streptomyces sp. BBFR115]|uniref:helix-turn-helix transcriptional regulator n=1 Tax=Streptomyces sp. BBFR115 TaxID=3448173 RepID=UPI003F76A521
MCRPEWRQARVQAQRLADLARLRRVRDRIDREYAQPLNVEALARDVNMSAGHLSRQFRAAYGESPYAYLMTRRIERATALLRRGDLSVTEVCFAVGCASLGTFTTRFTELVGMPPGAFRRQAAQAAGDTDTGTGTDAEAAGPGREAAVAITVDGMPACVAKQVTRPVRNREAPAPGQPLA